MKFRNPFQRADKRFLQSVRENDIEDVKKLLSTDGVSGFVILTVFLREEMWKLMTPEMFKMIVSEVDALYKSGKKVLGVEADWWNEVLLTVPVTFGRPEFLEISFPRIDNFNEGPSDSHIADVLIKSGHDRAEVIRYLKKIFSNGYGKIEDSDRFMTTAVEHNFTDALRLLCDIGFNPHKNNEELLRFAARTDKKEICLFLTGERMANIDLAITVERKLDNETVAVYLEQVKAEMPVRDEVAASPQLQSQRIRELQASVAEMTAQIEDMKGREVILDKMSLPAPKNMMRKI